MIQRLTVLSSVAALGVLAGCAQPSESISDLDRFDPRFGPDSGFGPTDASVDGGFVQQPMRLDQVLVAERPPPAVSGGTLSVSADGKIAVAADADRDAVYVVDMTSGEVRTMALAAGSEPGRVVHDQAGRAHVVLRGAGKIAQIDLEAGTVLKETAVCKLPRGLAHDPSQDALWVACASGELVSLAAADHAERSRKFVALDLRDVLVSAAGERFVSRYRSAELLRFDAHGALLGTTQPPTTLASSPRGAVRRSPALAWRTLLDLDGKPMMLHQNSQIDEVDLAAPGGYGGGCQTITQAGITRYDAEGKPAGSFTLGGAALTVDVALSPDSNTLVAATPGAYLRGERGSLQVVQLAALAAAVLDDGTIRAVDAGVPSPEVLLPGPKDAGLAGVGFARSPHDGGFVLGGCTSAMEQAHDIQVTAVAWVAANEFAVFSREPALLRTYTLESDVIGSGWVVPRIGRDIPLASTSVRDTGHELFHADVGSGLACASCHGEALDDGHVWTFSGFGARRTQTMRGGMLSTLPLHWEGDMPTFQHLVDEVMTRRMGGFKVEGKYADALAHWIDAQPELALDATNSSAAERGQALFESAAVGCASCHSGAMLTNNASYDVGTGGLFQVPSLRGLALRAPYMHDGCARTLHERFGVQCGGGNLHGKTESLTSTQIDDLVVYLQTL